VIEKKQPFSFGSFFVSFVNRTTAVAMEGEGNRKLKRFLGV
jgi:hypothetical protein